MKSMKFGTLLTQVLLGNDGQRVGLLNVLHGWPGVVLPAADSSVSFNKIDN